MDIDNVIFSPIKIHLQKNKSVSPDLNKIININSNNPLKFYIDETHNFIDHACKNNPLFLDIRYKTLPVSPSITLINLVLQYYNGICDFWISARNKLLPQCFTFTGEFGYFKFSSPVIPTKNLSYWYWLQTTKGQIAAIDYGIICKPRDSKNDVYNCFNTERDALDYYRS